VERDTGSNFGQGASTLHQRIISSNSYAHDEQGDNPEQEKEGSMVSAIICDRCWHFDYQRQGC